jgi:hypothetical protein
VFQGQSDIVQAVEQAIAAEGFDLEIGRESVSVKNPILFQIDR